MKTPYLIFMLLISTQINPAQAENNTVTTLLQTYASLGATEASAAQGKQLWRKVFLSNSEYSERSCASCHTEDLNAPGKHIKTGKSIKPMASSVNPERLSDKKKVEKWFKRNCKWTMGRECSVQEKASFLLYLNN